MLFDARVVEQILLDRLRALPSIEQGVSRDQ
jgi:hypothetical protein